MQIKKGDCSKCEKERPIVNKKHNLCQTCNNLRNNKETKTYTLKRTPITISPKTLQKIRERQKDQRNLVVEKKKTISVIPFKSEQLKKQSTPIKQVSKKLSKKRGEYNLLATQYKKDNPTCKVCEVNPTTDIHHVKGRVGPLLCDVNYFLNVCRTCHTKIEENPEWAKEMGYVMNRLN